MEEMVAASTSVLERDLDLEDSTPWSALWMVCSIAWTHSRRSSDDDASKCHVCGRGKGVCTSENTWHDSSSSISSSFVFDLTLHHHHQHWPCYRKRLWRTRSHRFRRRHRRRRFRLLSRLSSRQNRSSSFSFAASWPKASPLSSPVFLEVKIVQPYLNIEVSTSVNKLN